MLEQLKEKFLKFSKDYEELKDGFDVIYSTLNELEFNNDPSAPLMVYCKKLLNIAKEMSRLKSQVSIYSKMAKEYQKKEEAILYTKIKGESETNGKKTTEGYIESLINQDDKIYEIKLRKIEFEALETLIDDELKLIIEIIQLFKKIADVKSIIAVKLQETFDVGG